MPQFTISFVVDGPHCSSCTGLIHDVVLEDGEFSFSVENIVCNVGAVFNSTASVTVSAELDRENLDDFFEELKRVIIASNSSTFSIKAGYQITSQGDNEIKDGASAPAPAIIDINQNPLKTLPSVRYRKRVAQLALNLASFLFFTLGHKSIVSKWMGSLFLKIFLPIITLPLLFFSGRQYLEVPNILRPLTWGMDTLITLSVTMAWFYSCLIILKPSLFSVHDSDELFFSSPFMTFFVLILSSMVKDFILHRVEGEKIGFENALKRLQPVTARVGQGSIVDSREIKAGQQVHVFQGERLAVDCELLSGSVIVNEAHINGEKESVKTRGDTIYAGSKVVSAENAGFIAKVNGGYSRLNHMIAAAQTLKTQKQKLPLRVWLNTISRYFAMGVIGLSLVSAVLWALLGKSPATFMRAAMNISFAACPCSFALSVEIPVALFLNLMSHRGADVRDENIIENLPKVHDAAFDKTGTLTAPAVYSINTYGRYNEAALPCAVALEKFWLTSNEHPIARAIVRHAVGREEIDSPEVVLDENDSPDSRSKMGISGTVDSTPVVVGNASFMAFKGFVGSFEGDVFIAIHGELSAVINISHQLRPDAAEAIGFLNGKSIVTHMLTGHASQQNSVIVAGHAGIPQANVFSGLTAQQKEAYVSRLQHGVTAVLFVGDDLNDAQAAREANVSVAMGEDSPLAKTDVSVVLRSKLKTLIPLFEYANKTRASIRRNVFATIAYNVIAALLAGFVFPAFGIDVPPYGFGVAMGLSSALVVLHSVISLSCDQPTKYSASQAQCCLFSRSAPSSPFEPTSRRRFCC